jgi:phosphatidylglycerol:prolipoprotein diacylglycerol transferase
VNAQNHDLSGHFPLLRLSMAGDANTLELPTYFVIISIALCICVFWLVRRAEQAGLSRNRALDLAVVLMVSGIIGARFFHILFEEPAYYLENPKRALEIWRGGFVWFGGALGATMAGLLYLLWRQGAYGHWLDLFAPVCALGYAMGRVACLLTGCCYGRVCTLQSGLSFRLPSQLFAVLWELAVVGALLWLEKRRPSWLRRPGQLFLLWLILHSTGRVIMETMRADPRGQDLMGLSQATVLSLIIGIWSLYRITRSQRRREV